METNSSCDGRDTLVSANCVGRSGAKTVFLAGFFATLRWQPYMTATVRALPSSCTETDVSKPVCLSHSLKTELGWWREVDRSDSCWGKKIQIAKKHLSADWSKLDNAASVERVWAEEARQRNNEIFEKCETFALSFFNLLSKMIESVPTAGGPRKWTTYLTHKFYLNFDFAVFPIPSLQGNIISVFLS